MVERNYNPFALANSTIKDALLTEVSEQTGVSKKAILGDGRSDSVTIARRMVYKLAVEFFGLSSAKTGKLMGRDHTTVLSGIKSLNGWIEHNDHVRKAYERMWNNLAERF